MLTKTLMVQGTTSDAGKSTLVAGLCRVLARRGVRVAPFKPQNMALNSAVTVDGGEIGRAQAVQAMACRLAPHTDMNPVLLKPNTDVGAQVIIHGHALDTMDARVYHDYKTTAMEAVMTSYRRLADQYDVILVEGAGSPAEINLRDKDIANMGFAEAVDCPVILIADIDRGGVFAHLVGTLALLSPSEQARVRGFVINRFRGDLNLLTPGNDWLEQHTAKPVLGVLPYLHGLHLESEDSLSTLNTPAQNSNHLTVVIPLLPRISNHTDFDPLALHPQISLHFVRKGEPIPPADLVILPGSKSVRTDLAELLADNWDGYLRRHLRYGGKLLGICGGFQMLGETIDDPLGLEGIPGRSEGFGFLALSTTLEKRKQLKNVSGYLTLDQSPVAGYEIHAGVTSGDALAHPAIRLTHGPDGARSSDDQIIGTYVHGLFDQTQACTAWLRWAGLDTCERFDYQQHREAELDRLADSVETHLDLSLLT